MRNPHAIELGEEHGREPAERREVHGDRHVDGEIREPVDCRVEDAARERQAIRKSRHAPIDDVEEARQDERESGDERPAQPERSRPMSRPRRQR